MPKRSSALLINESPLQALPSLACLVGINGAIILQQIQYWLQSSEHRIEGYTWIYNTYDRWSQQFKWLKPRAIQKHILLLEKSGYIVSRQFKDKAKNNTKWYRIDYDRLNEEYQQLMDSEESNYLNPKSNTDSEESNHDSHLSSHKTKLNPRQITHKNTHKIIPEELEALQNLPYWVKEHRADIEWLSEFKEEFPDFNEKHIKACRDYWDGKRIKHKGQWKSRLRNWLKREKEFESSRKLNALPNESDLVAAAKEKGLNK